MKDLENNTAPGKALVDAEGLHHYTLSVASLEVVAADTALGAGCFFIRDDPGNPIELVQTVNS